MRWWGELKEPRESSPVSKDGLKSSLGGDEQLSKPLLERKPLQRGCCCRSLARNEGTWLGSARCIALSRDFTAEAVTSVSPGQQRGGWALPEPHSPAPNSSQSGAPAPSKPSGHSGSVPAAPGPSPAVLGVPAHIGGSWSLMTSGGRPHWGSGDTGGPAAGPGPSGSGQPGMGARVWLWGGHPRQAPKSIEMFPALLLPLVVDDDSDHDGEDDGNEGEEDD